MPAGDGLNAPLISPADTWPLWHASPGRGSRRPCDQEI